MKSKVFRESVSPEQNRWKPGNYRSVGASPLRPEKMSDLQEDEDRAESPVSSCVSMKSDRSRRRPPDFSREPGPSHSEQRSESPVSSCVSMKSDRSRRRPPDFSREPGPSHSEEKRSHVSEEKLPSCCASCQDVLKDPVSTSCGHWLCRRCITSYWDQSGSPGESSCPQCGQRSRTGPGAQTAG
ncbi:nuclear factor 7, brain-like isoform X1 [Scophthalmus maximus]|uniref:nuclear factor 7, brain-like isoform X1 n=1 Tax=Scophthalmus maximus TaxID=52904 RepID=UPI001FA831D8|nr:nuclear factor 7, brain-like isoform X1 [Scophthalmus maximus]